MSTRNPVSRRFSTKVASATPTTKSQNGTAAAPTLNGTAAPAAVNHDPSGKPDPKLVEQFRHSIKNGTSWSLDHSTLASVVDAMRHLNAIDDRKMLLEHVLVILSKLPDGSIKTKISNATVKLLYDDLPHPASTMLGPKYAYRGADGAGNNITLPDLGRGGMPYARSVQQNHPLPPHSLPDAGLVFDTLLKRDGFVKHPAGLSSLMFSFAALVIHTVFRTSHQDTNINETSSYVDLAPLYGHNQEAQDKVRVRDGRGLLKPDTFAEDRLLLLPPAVCVLLVLFSRNHNYIARKLLSINERGTWADPSKLASDQKKLMQQEEEIFQIARLINCGWFGSVVFSDYFSSILGLVRTGSSWSLNPFGEIRQEDHTLFERGRGNVCSVEFNCLYRWHATTSAEDEKWVEQLIGQLFKGKNPETLTVEDFKGMVKEVQAMEPDCDHWTFGGMQRTADGSGPFKDEDLANFLHNATEHPAGAFRARGTPHVMKLHEIMGIESNRRWGVCSLNDFRKFLGLKTYESFKEWNPDPAVYEPAERLYGHIDHLELYVGLQAEEAKPVIEGAGLCPGYTISRAILSDAIALTRGDRFFTADYTPFNLTAWGFADCQRDPNSPGFGSMLGRLLLRTLPNHFTDNSVYTWFPLMTPDSMKENLKVLKQGDKYDFARPKFASSPQVVEDHATVQQIIKDKDFHPPYHQQAQQILKGKGFYLAAENPERAEEEQKEVIAALVKSPEVGDQIAQSVYVATQTLIKENAYACVGGEVVNVDVVRDVLNYAPLYWAAEQVAGVSLKTPSNPHGTYTPKALFDKLGDIYAYLFLDVDPGQAMVLREKVSADAHELLQHIKSNLNVGGGARRLSVFGIFDTIQNIFSAPKEKAQRQEILHRLFEISHNSDQLANSVLAILVGSTVELSLSATNVVNLLIDSDYANDLRTLSTSEDPKDLSKLQGYVWEAARIDPAFRGVYRVAKQDKTVAEKNYTKGDKVFLDIASAHKDEKVFQNPQAVDPTRPKETYINAAVNALGDELTAKILTQVVRAIFSLQNVRRGPGNSGVLPRFIDERNPVLRYGYLDNDSVLGPWATSMTVQFDGPNVAAATAPTSGATLPAAS